MSNPKRVKTFLGRLESSANDKDRGLKALQVREEAHLSPYVQSKTWQGQKLHLHWSLGESTCWNRNIHSASKLHKLAS